MAMVHSATVLLLVVLAGYSCSLAAAKKGRPSRSAHVHGHVHPPPLLSPPAGTSHDAVHSHLHDGINQLLGSASESELGITPLPHLHPPPPVGASGELPIPHPIGTHPALPGTHPHPTVSISSRNGMEAQLVIKSVGDTSQKYLRPRPPPLLPPTVHSHLFPAPPPPPPPPAPQPGNCHPPGYHPSPHPSHSGSPPHGPCTSTDATAASTDATATTAAATTAASSDVAAAAPPIPAPDGPPPPPPSGGQPPPPHLVHPPPLSAPAPHHPPPAPHPPPPPPSEMGQDISSDHYHPIHAPPPSERQPPSPETSIGQSHLPLPYSDSQHPHHVAATDDSSSSSTQPAMQKKISFVPSNDFGKMSAKSNLIMLQFNMKNEISEFSSQANVFSKTLKGVLSIGTLFESLKTLILAIIKSDDGLSVIVAVEFVYNKTNKKMDIEETRKLFLHTIDFNINDFDLNGFYITSMKAVEFNSANDKLENETDLVGSNKVLVGTVVGSLALITMAALVVAGMVMYHKKAPRNYEKLPLIIDESATKWPWNKKKNGSYNDKF